MKNKYGFAILVLGIFGGCSTRVLLPPVLEHTMVLMDGSGKSIPTLDALVKRTEGSDVVFVGEIHNDSLTHVVELELARRMAKQNSRLGIAMEMFERDAQKVLNGYLEGQIPEAEFLRKSKPPSNYGTDYRPLIEFARESRLTVIAMNVPRRIANRVAMGGEGVLASLPDSEKVWVAGELKPLDDEYKKRFLDEMGGERPGPMAKLDPENLYKAQVLKDDTMAESIREFLLSHRGGNVLSIVGDFHSAYGLGVVKKIRLMAPSVRTSIVSIVPVENIETLDFKANQGRGDYIVFVRRLKAEKTGNPSKPSEGSVPAKPGDAAKPRGGG